MFNLNPNANIFIPLTFEKQKIVTGQQQWKNIFIIFDESQLI